MQKNIILIGMAGCGKSTVGVLLAKALGCAFIDTDLIIQQREGKLLQEIINSDGVEAFKAAEERALLDVDASLAVIATGGSAVYSAAGMAHLRKNGVCVWLSLPFAEIERRIHNIATRGIAIAPGKTLRDAYDEREPLYERYADITVSCTGGIESTVAAVMEALR
ncbi:MAG: shikimate kinase [Ruminococcaceae bacterium]|nr:shikimate kinase [Oscillospiraceae bacterium]